MSGRDARHVGIFVEQQAEELTRIWRLARADERRAVFPGLIDGVVESFLGRAGELLGTGAAPAEPFRRTAGVLRWAPALDPSELSAEWGIVAEVLETACDSVNADPAAAAWLSAAAAAADAASAAALAAPATLPRGVVLVRVWSRMAPPEPRESR